MGFAETLYMFRFFNFFSLDAISKTFSDKECFTLNKSKLERQKRYDSI